MYKNCIVLLDKNYSGGQLDQFLSVTVWPPFFSRLILLGARRTRYINIYVYSFKEQKL